MSDKNSLEATEYVHRGPKGQGVIILRAALSADDPESWQSLWKGKFGDMRGFPYKEIGFSEPPVCQHCGGTGREV